VYWLARNEEVLLAERIGMQKPRPAAADQTVQDDRFDFLPEAGHSLYGTNRLVAAPRGIEDDKLTLARWIMMAANDGNHLGRMIRDQPGKEYGRRPERITAVVQPWKTLGIF